MGNKSESFGKFGDIDFTKLNIGQIIKLCLKCETKEDASEVLRQYEKYHPPAIARSNLGYIFGYCDPEDRKRLYALFHVDHPAFGPDFGRGFDPSPEEAFKTGNAMGEEIKKDMKKQ